MGITKLETEFLEGLKQINCGDQYQCTETLSYFVLEDACNGIGLDIKQTRGVLSSLVQKNIIVKAECEQGHQYYEYNWGE